MPSYVRPGIRKCAKNRALSSIDVHRAKAFFEQCDHTPLPVFKVRMRATNMLRRFVLIGGFDIDDAYDTDTQDGMEGKHH